MYKFISDHFWYYPGKFITNLQKNENDPLGRYYVVSCKENIMRNEQDKYEVEQQVVLKLSKQACLGLDEGSLRKGNPNQGEPDIYCICSEEPMYFEVAEACVPEFAEAIASAKRSEDVVSSATGGDGISNVLLKKLGKNYKVTQPIELVLYVDGRNGLPKDVLVPIAKHTLRNGCGPFRRVWLCSNGVFELTSDCS